MYIPRGGPYNQTVHYCMYPKESMGYSELGVVYPVLECILNKCNADTKITTARRIHYYMEPAQPLA